MDFDKLLTFLTVADTKSFSRTAELLHVSQSTVTTRIKQLEGDLGKPLFLRDTRHVDLTSSAKALYPYLKRSFEIIKEGELAAKSILEFDDSLGVGCFHSIWHALLLPVVQSYQRIHPSFAVRNFSGSSERLIQLMLDGIADISIIATVPKYPDLESVSMFNENFVLIGNLQQVSDDVILSPESLRSLPFVFMKWESPFADWFEREISIHFYPITEVDDSTLLLRYIVENNGISFMPYSVASVFMKKYNLKIYQFSKETPIRTLYLTYRKRRLDSIALCHFLELIHNRISCWSNDYGTK